MAAKERSFEFTKEKLAFLLIGKTGEGKSDTGNTILGQEVFSATDSAQSVTREVAKIQRDVFENDVTVVDTPGVIDTKVGDEILKEIAHAVLVHPEGYDAFLIVVKYPTRWTEEANKAIVQLERLFGTEFYNYCIVVMTHGDMFKAKLKKSRSDKTFQDFINNLRLGDVLPKVRHRAVLFDNMQLTSNREDMVDELFRQVKKVRSDSNVAKRYDNAIFQQARLLRSYVGLNLEMKVDKLVDFMKGLLPW